MKAFLELDNEEGAFSSVEVASCTQQERVWITERPEGLVVCIGNNERELLTITVKDSKVVEILNLLGRKVSLLPVDL